MEVLIRKIPSRLHLGESRPRELVRNQRLFHWVSDHLFQSFSKQISSKLILPRIHCSEPGAGDAQFVPLPEDMPGYYPVTMSLISSHAIFRAQFREDPIFPARQKAIFLSKD
jgi:hypothetical protein